AGIGEPGMFQVRLFPVRGDIRWMCRVRVVIWPAIRRVGMSLQSTGVVVRHTGYGDPAVVARKRRRNEDLLRTWSASRPDDPFALWHTGRIAAARGDWPAALDLYRRSLEAWPSDLAADAPRVYFAIA